MPKRPRPDDAPDDTPDQPTPGKGKGFGGTTPPPPPRGPFASPKENARHVVLAYLLRGADNELAAKQAGISVRTLRNWRKRPSFKKALARGRRRIINRAVRLIESSLFAAAVRLNKIIQEGADSNAIGAADRLFDLYFRFRSMGELEKRVAALEDAGSTLD